jgi:hypothetical protein
MSELASIERRLARAIAGNEDAGDLLRPNRQGGEARLSIYREGYRLRLAEALGSNFPILKAVLGDDDFERMAFDYIEDHPSQSPSIRWFGEHLVEWLAADDARIGHPSLIDLARMEWALGTAFDGPDAEALGFADLSTIAPERWPQLRFAPHPCVRVIALSWNVEPHWKALTADVNAETEAPVEVGHHLLVWRNALETQWRSVENDEAELLIACFAGEDFSMLCLRAERRHGEEAAQRVAGLLRAWVEAGILARTLCDEALGDHPSAD